MYRGCMGGVTEMQSCFVSVILEIFSLGFDHPGWETGFRTMSAKLWK